MVALSRLLRVHSVLKDCCRNSGFCGHQDLPVTLDGGRSRTVSKSAPTLPPPRPRCWESRQHGGVQLTDWEPNAGPPITCYGPWSRSWSRGADERLTFTDLQTILQKSDPYSLSVGWGSGV
jgi:hypothetical protein